MAPGHYIMFDLRFPCLRFCLFFTGSLAHAKAFFLHTPFPSYEADSKLPPTLSWVYVGLWHVMTSLDWLLASLGISWHLLQVLCVLPQCVDVVEGVLGADLIGFHTYNYLCHWWIQLELSVLCWDLIHHYVWHIIYFLSHFSPPFPSYLLSFILLLDHNDHTFLLRRHFRSCVIRLCGFTPEMDHVDHRGQRTKLGVFPIGANARPSNHTDSAVECNQSGGLGILMEGTWITNFAVLLWSFLIRCPSLAACVLCWGSGCDGSYEDSALQNSWGGEDSKDVMGSYGLWALLKDRTYAQLSTFCSSQPSPQLETLTPNRRKIYRARCPQLWFAVLPGDTTCKVGPMFLRAQNAGTQSMAFAKI